MPSFGRIQNELYYMTAKDLDRLESFEHAEWRTKSVLSHQTVSGAKPGIKHPKIMPFTLHTGRLGFTCCKITETDEIIRFHGSDVALVVPGVQGMFLQSPYIQVKGRALILKSDNTEEPPGFRSSFNAKFEWAVPSV